MIDTNPLEGPSTIQTNSNKVKNIVVMLHGYGSNGYDLIQLAYEWQDEFPNTLFSSPNAPFKFDNYPGRFKWFEVYPDGVSIDKASETQKKAVKENFNHSCNLIKTHIDKVSNEYKVEINNIFLLGFSQGSMMSIEVGTSLDKRVAGVISLSGRIYSDDFNSKIRNKIPILVVHGDNDDIIKPHRYHETCSTLEASGYNIEKHLIKNLGHTISSEVAEISKKFFESYQ